MGFGGLVLVLLAGALASSHLLDKHQPTRNLTCSQGLDQCRVETREFQPEPLNAGPVEVSGLDVKAALCCKDQKCSACLLITVRLKILDEEEVSGEQLEDEDKEDDEDDGERLSEAAVTVCFYSGPNLPNYKVISFKVTPAARQNPGNAQLTLVEYRDVFLGSTVNVTVRSLNRTVTLPRPKEVCPSAGVEECNPPRVLPVFGREKGVVELKVAEEDAGQAQPLRICVKRGPEGMCQKSSTVIPLHTVTPCMCIEAWVEGSMSRSASCPFAEYQEFRENVWRNMSLSVGHSETNDGRPMLRWTLSAPCRVKAEVWPCRIGVGSGQSCREVDGFRQRCNGSSNWREDSATLWTSGEFVDVSSENLLLHCVMFQAEGRTFGPVCQHDTQRGRWSVLVLMALLVFILVGVAVCFLRNRLRGCVSDWETSHSPGGARGEVLLLHASGSDVAEAALVCRLGVELSELGFAVSLDLWSQAELSSLGPGPWLHSKLDLLQRRGGKALLVLSDSALGAAQACWDGWSGETTRAAGPPPAKMDRTAWDKPSPCLSDVFGSALSYVFSMYQKGGAAEHFVLVHLDSRKLLNGERAMPLLFQGLQLYTLPSESRQLLGQLCPERQESFSMRLKRLLWLRRASGRLTKGLKDAGKGSRPHSQSVLTQVEILEEERLPLHV